MKKIVIDSSKGAYEVVIEKGLFSRVCDWIKPQGMVAIITDVNVEALYSKALLVQLHTQAIKHIVISVPAGESSKSLVWYEKICLQLLEAGFNRKGLIIALGGGVIGDLAGFVASTLLRGVDYIAIPTTLLAQVDSSVGGKVAVNIGIGKNLIGAFYPPQRVLIDPLLLKSLPKRIFCDGMAEAIKCGCIKDEALFTSIRTYATVPTEMLLEQIVTRCVEIKASVVMQDEFETGERMKLNFGHTLGHALEAYYQYDVFRHGEAISIGMCEITNWSERNNFTAKGTLERLVEVLESYALPTKLPFEDKSLLREQMKYDKKNDDQGLRLVLVKKLGDSLIHPIALEVWNESYI